MNHVYLLIDEQNNVVAIYSEQELAEKLKKPVEQKLNVKLRIEKRSVNLDIKTVGVLK